MQNRKDYSWIDVDTFLKDEQWLNLKEGMDFEHDSTNENYILKSCPVCGGGASGDEKTFSIKIKNGISQCFRGGCGWRGNIYKLKTHLFPSQSIHLSQVTDILPDIKKYKKVSLSDWTRCFEEPLYLPEGQEALNYLTNTRKFTIETLKYFHIGIKKFNDILFIAFPYLNEKGDEVIKIKYRSIGNPKDGKKIMFSEEGMRADVLYNLPVLPSNDEVIIQEGEIDTLTMHQLGFKNVVSIPSGVSNKKGLSLLKDKKRIYILYDQDIEAQKYAQNSARFLGLNKTFNVTFPGYKDPNEILQKGGQEKATSILSQAIKEAKKIDLDFIIPFSSAINTLIEEELFGQQLGETTQVDSVSFPFQNLNKIIGNLIGGDLVILSGHQNVGKTSFLLQTAFETAKRGIPVFFFCLEMPFKRLAKKLVQSALQIDKVTSQHLEAVYNTFQDLPIYFINKIQSFNKEWVFNVIEDSIIRYDLGLVIFDNLQMICSDTIGFAKEETTKTIQNFKLLAEKYNIPIFVISQLRKVDSGTIPSIVDLKESSALGYAPDIVIFIYRQPLFESKGADLDGTETTNLFSKYTLIRVEKNRYEPTGEVWLVFEGEKSYFREMKDDSERLNVLEERQLVTQMRKAKRKDSGY